MAKHETYGREAEALYVRDGLTISEISRRLGLSRRTLIKWRNLYQWDEKRIEYLRNMEDVKGDIVQVVKALVRKLRLHYEDPENHPPLSKEEEARLNRLLTAVKLTDEIKTEQKAVDRRSIQERLREAMELFL